MSQPPEDAKMSYAKPELVSYGTIEAITASTNIGSPDGVPGATGGSPSTP